MSKRSPGHSGACVVGVDLRAMSTGVVVSSDGGLEPSDDAIWVAHIFDQPPQSVGQRRVTGHPKLFEGKVAQIDEVRLEVSVFDNDVDLL